MRMITGPIGIGRTSDIRRFLDWEYPPQDAAEIFMILDAFIESKTLALELRRPDCVYDKVRAHGQTARSWQAVL
jgi:hypothetical protein